MKANRHTSALDSLCDLVAQGKQAAREIAELSSHFQIKEPEFRLLHCLKKTASPLDQRQLASSLTLSPAQVCALVEQLSRRGFIHRQQSSADRRRSLWEISENGSALIREIEKFSDVANRKAEIDSPMPRRRSA